jgi:hypothetical protein
MLKRPLLAGVAILLTWTLVDLLLHRLFLAPIYESSANLWRPFHEMKITLIYAVTFTLLAVFVATYKLLVRPKSLATGLRFGALIGLALGMSTGFGTYIHMPIPLPLAWGWFLGGWLKGIAAGAFLGALIRDPEAP